MHNPIPGNISSADLRAYGSSPVINAKGRIKPTATLSFIASNVLVFLELHM
jgi:hypothetical protein